MHRYDGRRRTEQSKTKQSKRTRAHSEHHEREVSIPMSVHCAQWICRQCDYYAAPSLSHTLFGAAVVAVDFLSSLLLSLSCLIFFHMCVCGWRIDRQWSLQPLYTSVIFIGRLHTHAICTSIYDCYESAHDMLQRCSDDDEIWIE